MTLESRSRIEYLILNERNLLLLLHSNLSEKFSLNAFSLTVFQYDLITIRMWLTFLGHPVYRRALQSTVAARSIINE